MTHWKFQFLVLPLLAAGCAGGSDSNPSYSSIEPQNGDTIALADGVVHGSTDGGTRTFFGVPYAAAPTGLLRFRPPQPVPAWRSTLDATAGGVSCIQPEDEPDLGVPETEDCLKLNVFAPERSNANTLVPVLVWLHGGDDTRGSANEIQPSTQRRRYDGAALRAASREEVVVVTLDYRLGTLGFLAYPTLTEEEGMSGNYGLMDQQAALRWVQRNVRAFGGDPQRVTLIGQGAGATDACLQMTATSSKDLFHAAVLESGACGDRDLSFQEPAHARGVSLARELGCDKGDPAQRLECLRAVPAERFARTTTTDATFASFGTLAIIDGVFLREQPRAALEAGRFAQVPVIVGSNSREGSYFVRDGNALATDADYRRWLERVFGAEHADAIAATYALGDDVAYPQIIARDLVLDALAEQVVTDAFFTCPAQRVADTLSRFTDVYRYAFVSSAYVEPYAGLGATHGVETLWVWNIWEHASSSSPDDGELSARILGYWSRLSSGDPNADGAPEWPRYDDARTELILNPDARTTTGAYDRCDFWTELFAVGS